MLGNIIGFFLLAFLILFVIGSCIVSSQTDEELENLLRRGEENEKKNI